MPKKIRFESAVHQFFAAADRFRSRLQLKSKTDAVRFADWVREVKVDYPASRFRVSWEKPIAGALTIEMAEATFYVRGDRLNEAADGSGSQEERTWLSISDPVQAANAAFFDRQLQIVIAEAGLFEERKAVGSCAGNCNQRDLPADNSRKIAEAHFHDMWAAGVDVSTIDVRKMNEACTAPEMRYIRSALGDIEGKQLLDVGCGLGEASVYFAIEGAVVTASDISQGMLDATNRLAAANGVPLKTELSASEDLGIQSNDLFDIIYIGNTLHHVDIARTLDQLLPLLKPDGVFVSWDPLAYNPVINIYRSLAMEVRTDDEHPLRLSDLRLMRKRFQLSRTRYFWLATLVIFVIMALVQRRSPNKERYWKKVIEEADAWSWIYNPLEMVDSLLLAVFPFMRPLCWNVVFVGKHPITLGREPMG